MDTLDWTPKGYVCRRAQTAPPMDGRLDHSVWEAADWTDLFVDIEGDAKPRPRFATRAKMLWDDECFYIGAHLEEPHVWATLTEHDSVIFHDNDFEIFIDPDGDNQSYFEIEINALNTTWDLRLVKAYRDGGPALNEWEAEGMRTAVHVDGTINDPRDVDKGWSVVFAIPWKAFAEFGGMTCPPVAADQWRLNFSRVEWITDIIDGKYVKREGLREDNWVWSPQAVIDMHQPERWGYVQFAAGDEEFVYDETLPARRRLMDFYHRQKDIFDKTKRFATAHELGFCDICCEMKGAGYEATLSTPRGILHVTEDSRLWMEP